MYFYRRDLVKRSFLVHFGCAGEIGTNQRSDQLNASSDQGSSSDEASVERAHMGQQLHIPNFLWGTTSPYEPGELLPVNPLKIKRESFALQTIVDEDADSDEEQGTYKRIIIIIILH